MNNKYKYGSLSRSPSPESHSLTVKSKRISLDLSEREIELLRNSVSDLGIEDNDCLRLQLKIADAILDAKPRT